MSTRQQTPNTDRHPRPLPPRRQLTFADLFCGAGGLSLGFRNAGFKCLCAIDNDHSALTTYRRNFDDHIILAEIAENTPIPSVDVIIGGPPCQGFSSAGIRRHGDKRNTLVRVFSELVARHTPRAFVFENVEGFLTTDRGDRVFDLLQPLLQAGYRIHLRKLNAANYGVPQHRKRIIAIGALGTNITFPHPTHRAFGAPGASRAFRHLPPSPTVADALAGLPSPTDNPPGIPSGHYARPLSDTDRRRIQLLQPGQTMKHLPPELWHDSYRRRAYRRVMDGTPTQNRGGAPAALRRLHPLYPSKAITSGAISEFIHPSQDRFLTVRESARIQTFPDDFVFLGTLAEGVAQIANAVPPRLAEALALNLRDDLLCTQSAHTCPHGALLSFVPTFSPGKSPALDAICRRVEEQLTPNQSYHDPDQLPLWR